MLISYIHTHIVCVCDMMLPFFMNPLGVFSCFSTHFFCATEILGFPSGTSTDWCERPISPQGPRLIAPADRQNPRNV